jgi:hypothetical protein
MNREELITALSERLDVPAHSIRVFLHAWFDTAKSLLRAGEVVDLGGLGSFEYIRNNTSGAIRYYPPLPRSADTAPRARREDFVLPMHAIAHSHAAPADPVDVASLVAELLPRQAATHHDHSPGTPVSDEPYVDETYDPVVPDAWADGDVADEEQALEAFEEEVSAHSNDDLISSDATQAYATPDGSGAVLPVDVVPEVTLFSAATDVRRETAGADMVVQTQSAADIRTEAVVPDFALAGESEHQDFSDDDSFYKHRDQLYNPPEKQTSRGLFITAVLLTLGVLAIILYLLYTDAPVHELPGINPSTGHVQQVPCPYFS